MGRRLDTRQYDPEKQLKAAGEQAVRAIALLDTVILGLSAAADQADQVMLRAQAEMHRLATLSHDAFNMKADALETTRKLEAIRDHHITG